MGEDCGAGTVGKAAAAELGRRHELLSGVVPQISIIEAPYIWKDSVHMARALQSPLMDELNKANIFIDDSVASSMPELRAKARRRSHQSAGSANLSASPIR